MLNRSGVEAVIRSIQQRADKSPRIKITRRHSEELMRYSQEFGVLRAEVFSCRAQGMNELEVLAETHSLFMRCGGTASRFEVTWSDRKDHQKLSEFKPGWIVFTPASSSVRMIKKDQGSHLALPPQAGPCNAELFRVVLAMKDEMDNPG